MSDKPQKPSYRWYVLVMLTLVYVFNFIDRQIIGTLGPFIKADLNLSDGVYGALGGIVFAAFYCTIAFPIAWLADRKNRVTILSVCLAIWSGFTALTGMAQNTWQIILARMGVGVGEAGGSPPSHSMISDLFDKEERSKALGIYALGIPLGVMTAYFASAFLLTGAQVDWRVIMISLGVPGVVLAILLKLTVKEPVRGALDVGHDADSRSTFAEAVSVLAKIPSYWFMCLGIAFASFGAYALSHFVVVFFRTAFPDFSLFTLLMVLGVLNGVVYFSGTYFGGWLTDKLGKDNKGAYASVPAWGLILGAPCLIASFWMPSAWMALGLSAIYLFTAGLYLGPSFAIAQTLAPINVRATSTALYFFVLNMIGLGGGPTLVGIASTMLEPAYGEDIGRRIALSGLAVTFVISIAFFFLAAKALPKDWDAAMARNAKNAEG